MRPGRNLPAITTIVLAVGGCAEPAHTIPLADSASLTQLTAYGRLSDAHRLELAPSDEPGSRLLILGRLVQREDGSVITDHAFSLYQADETGSYGEEVNGDESTARLHGTVRTDSLGRFLISTILPGDYGSGDNNRHVHTSVPEAHPEAYDLFFAPFVSRGLRSWAESSDQGMILELRQSDEGLIAIGDLVVKRFRDEQE